LVTLSDMIYEIKITNCNLKIDKIIYDKIRIVWSKKEKEYSKCSFQWLNNDLISDWWNPNNKIKFFSWIKIEILISNMINFWRFCFSKDS
jgi:hypothetical protein